MTDRHAFSRRTAVMAICVICASPAAFSDPVVPGFVVDQYASVPTPGGLAFDPDGVLYVGNLDPGTVSIHRVAVGGFPVEDYGPTAFDPDAVAFDANGSVSGISGAVLVGGGTGTGAPPPSGYVLAIAPDQSASYLFGSPTTLFRNPSVMKLDRAGRLVFTDPRTATEGYVFASSGGPPVALYNYGAPYTGLAVDASNRLYTVDSSGRVIQVHDSNGNLIDDSFAEYSATIHQLAFGPDDPVWQGKLYAACASTGELLRIDESGEVTVIGTGFGHPTSLAFGPHDHNLYVSSQVLNAIYRVAKWTQWPSEDGGNGHYYMVVEVPDGISWTQANEEALRALPRSHLATITSPEEDAFVAGLLRERLPATGPTGAWVGAVQTAGADAPDAGWRWTTDEPFAFTNWAPGEPNDWAYDEIYVEVYPRYPSNDTLAWNDCCGGAPINEDRYLYVVETPSLVAVTPVEVVVRTWPYWKVVGEVDLSTDTSLTVMVASGGPVDPTNILFDTVEIVGFDRNALRGPVFRDYSRDGLLDYIVWYRLDRMAPLACGEYDQRFDAMTSEGQMLTGRLRFVVSACAP